MTSREGALRLRLYIHESQRHGRITLYEYLVDTARRGGLAGATVFRGIEGFGQHHHIHTARLVDTSNDLPIVVELVDRADVIRRYLDTVRPAIGHGAATLTPVEMHVYAAGTGS